MHFPEQYLSDHLTKNCRNCIKVVINMDLTKTEQNDGSEVAVQPVSFPALEEIEAIMQRELPQYIFTDAGQARTWYAGLYAGLVPSVETLVTKKEDGTLDYSELAKQIAYSEVYIKVMKSKRSALETVRHKIITDATLEQKAKIYEEDRKYKPIFKEDKPKVEKLSETEKNIRKLVKVYESIGMDEQKAREKAESYVLGKAK